MVSSIGFITAAQHWWSQRLWASAMGTVVLTMAASVPPSAAQLPNSTAGFPAQAVEPAPSFQPIAQSGASCSGELTEVIDALMLALPNYANRVIQRQRVGRRGNDGIWRSDAPRTYVTLAGQPTIESLTSSQFAPSASSLSDRAPLYQIFFTTLERQYFQAATGLAEPQTVQQFHQLVLARVEPPEHWRVIRLRSQWAPYPAEGQRLSPPRNADNGATAKAIRLWLRDCTAGSEKRG